MNLLFILLIILQGEKKNKKKLIWIHLKRVFFFFYKINLNFVQLSLELKRQPWTSDLPSRRFQRLIVFFTFFFLFFRLKATILLQLKFRIYCSNEKLLRNGHAVRVSENPNTVNESLNNISKNEPCSLHQSSNKPNFQEWFMCLERPIEIMSQQINCFFIVSNDKNKFATQTPIWKGFTFDFWKIDPSINSQLFFFLFFFLQREKNSQKNFFPFYPKNFFFLPTFSFNQKLSTW